MGEISLIASGVSTVEKFLPIVEAVGKEIGPLVQAELADGKVIWGDVLKAYNDLKSAFAAVKTAEAAK